MRENDLPSRRIITYLSFLLTVMILAVVVFVRIRLLQTPLERDEGEYAYMGQLILKGIHPYMNAYTMKLPGVSVAYALIMLLFGRTISGIHLGLLFVNAIGIFLVYLLGKRLFDRNTAIISCAAYAVLSLSQSVLGVFAHATHFVVLFYLAGLLFLLHAVDERRTASLLTSGLFFGLAITMKQHAVLLIVFAFMYLAWRSRKHHTSWKHILCVESTLFLLGILIPYALIALWMAYAGVFGTFWFWTVQYAREYTSELTLVEGVTNFQGTFAGILHSQLFLCILAGAGGILLCTKYVKCADRFFMAGLALFSFLAICPGFYFRNHYFILILPAMALLIGAAIHSAEPLCASFAWRGLQRFIPILLFITAIAYGVYQEREYLFTSTPREVCRSAYDLSPFPEAVQIAAYLKERTAPKDRIAVLGSEPEICFYADRLSATGHIYMYGLMEKQPYAERMQKEMIREIETTAPEYIVMTMDALTLWPTESKLLFDWANNFVGRRYYLVGVIDIINSGTTHYLWDRKAENYTPISGTYLTVHKRKTRPAPPPPAGGD